VIQSYQVNMSCYHRSDKNQQEIVDGLRQIGCLVKVVSAETSGFVDLIVGWQGRTFLVEIKHKDGRFTEQEREFLRIWKDQVIIADSIEDIVMEIYRRLN